MKVEWQPISYPEGYLISNDGRVYSLKRNRELKLYQRPDGYLSIALGVGVSGKTKRYLVHRLVALAFIPNPHNYDQINHKDENKTNNNVDNLEWCNSKYNANYGTRNAKCKQYCNWIKANEKRIRPVIQYTKDGVFVAKYLSAVDAERKTGFSSKNIGDCCRGHCSHYKRHTAYGYVWKYEEE